MLPAHKDLAPGREPLPSLPAPALHKRASEWRWSPSCSHSWCLWAGGPASSPCSALPVCEASRVLASLSRAPRAQLPRRKDSGLVRCLMVQVRSLSCENSGELSFYLLSSVVFVVEPFRGGSVAAAKLTASLIPCHRRRSRSRYGLPDLRCLVRK